MTTLERIDAREKEAALRRRLDATRWWITQLIPTPDRLWVVVLAHDEAELKLAYTDEDRLEALRRAVEAAEGRAGRG